MESMYCRDDYSRHHLHRKRHGDGPRTDPCGTPEVTSSPSIDDAPSTARPYCLRTAAQKTLYPSVDSSVDAILFKLRK